MPELPEVQTVVNHIRPTCVGKRLKRIKPVWDKVLQNFGESDMNLLLDRPKVIDVFRRAKFIVIKFKNHIIAIHLRMTGKLDMTDAYFQSKHITAVLEFEDNYSLFFEDVRKFGRIYLYDDLTVIDSKHGPEPLEENFTYQSLKKMISPKRRNIKALLLDQTFLSGLGNIYVDESLWKSGIHPNSTANSVPKNKVISLHSNIRLTLQEAIDNNGTTIIDFNVNGESGRYTNYLCVYGRADELCLKCNNKIKKLKVAGRGTYVCIKCQKKYTKRHS